MLLSSFLPPKTPCSSSLQPSSTKFLLLLPNTLFLISFNFSVLTPWLSHISNLSLPSHLIFILWRANLLLAVQLLILNPIRLKGTPCASRKIESHAKNQLLDNGKGPSLQCGGFWQGKDQRWFGLRKSFWHGKDQCGHGEDQCGFVDCCWDLWNSFLDCCCESVIVIIVKFMWTDSEIYDGCVWYFMQRLIN